MWKVASDSKIMAVHTWHCCHSFRYMLVGLCNPWQTFPWKHQPPFLHDSSACHCKSRPSTTGKTGIREFSKLSFLLSLPKVSTPDFGEGLRGARNFLTSQSPRSIGLHLQLLWQALARKKQKAYWAVCKGNLCMICYVTFFWYTTCHSMTHYDISFSDIWYWYVIYEVMYKYMIIISHWYALCSTGIYCRCIFIRIYSFHYPWIY